MTLRSGLNLVVYDNRRMIERLKRSSDDPIAADTLTTTGLFETASLTTAAGTTATITIPDAAIAAADICLASLVAGTSTTGRPILSTVTPGTGQVVVVIVNAHPVDAFNGTLKIAYARVAT